MILQRLSLALAFGVIATASLANNCGKGCAPPPVDPPKPPVIIVPPVEPEQGDRDPWVTTPQVSYGFCCPWRGQLRFHTAFGRNPEKARADCVTRAQKPLNQCSKAIGHLIDRADARKADLADGRSKS